MGQTLQGIVDFAAPVVLTATGHPELAAAYSGASSYAKTGDPLTALASAGTQYAGNQFFGKAGQLGAPSAPNPLASGINAGTQLAAEAAEQSTLSGLEALKNNVKVPFESLSMGDKLGSFGKGLESLTSSSGRQALVDAYGGSGLKAGLGAAAFASPVLTPLLTPEPIQEEESYWSGPSESVEDLRRRVRGYAEGGITDLEMVGGGGAFDARTKLPSYNEPMDTYAKGGYLDGPGDGMSDSIPATIADRQPARLADGEFVIPADVVSHLGNGSTKAGAKRLYAMMDKVRKARTGTTKQGRQINPNKYMPV
jgi:hypothetical protein